MMSKYLVFRYVGFSMIYVSGFFSMFAVPDIGHGNIAFATKIPVMPRPDLRFIRPRPPSVKPDKMTGSKKSKMVSVRLIFVNSNRMNLVGKVDASDFPESLRVFVRKEDLMFKKSLDMSDLRVVRVLCWRGIPTSVSPKRIVYLFQPSEYEVTVESGQKYRLQNRCKYFEVLDVHTESGATRVYSIFYDTWLKREKIWLNSSLGTLGMRRKKGHEKNIFEIHFEAPGRSLTEKAMENKKIS